MIVPKNQHEYEGALAAEYESLRKGEEKWQREQAAVKVLLESAVADGSSVLDVPVGTGRFLETYARHHYRPIGIDLSADMLAQARRAARGLDHAFGEIVLDEGDIAHIDLDAKSVDATVCIRLMNLIPFEAFEQALQEIARVTRHVVIVGIRTHGPRGLLHRLNRRVRRTVRRSPVTLHVHSERRVRRAFARLGLAVEREEIIAIGTRSTSRYSIYLLRVAEDRAGEQSADTANAPAGAFAAE